MSEIDLSKYAAGKQLEVGSRARLISGNRAGQIGKIIEDYEPAETFGFLSDTDGSTTYHYRDRFVPIDAEPALSPGHALREPVRLNEAQREAVGRVDKYNPDGLKPEVRLEFEKARRVAMDDKDARSGRRDKLIAALRRDLDDGSRMKAFPKEGRLCRVYRSNDR